MPSVGVCVPPFQLPNYLTDFHKTLCECFDFRGYPKTVISNFRKRVLTILRTRYVVKRVMHWRYLLFTAEIIVVIDLDKYAFLSHDFVEFCGSRVTIFLVFQFYD